VVTLAKGLGGGLPIGACLAFGSAADLLGPGSHASTFGGNPVSCAVPVSATVVESLAHNGFLTNAVQPDAVRLAPPLVLSADQADAFLAALPAALDAAVAA
jgi:acetylornithine aminotransferase